MDNIKLERFLKLTMQGRSNNPENEMKSILKSMVIGLALQASTALAAIDGNELRALNQSAFYGYIYGVADSFMDEGYCPPKGINYSQIVAIVKKYLNNNPKYWNENATTLILTALMIDYPCAKEKASTEQKL